METKEKQITSVSTKEQSSIMQPMGSVQRQEEARVAMEKTTLLVSSGAGMGANIASVAGVSMLAPVLIGAGLSALIGGILVACKED